MVWQRAARRASARRKRRVVDGNSDAGPLSASAKSKWAAMTLLVVLSAAGVTAWWSSERGPGTIRVVLADGSSAVCARESVLSTQLGYPGRRVATLDGECWVSVVAGRSALVLRSRLMVLTVPGAARIHVVARAREAGEQVEVLEGTVTAVKNYPSAYSTPDDLVAGEMSMVNQSIDLQEKEKMNEKEFAALRAGFRSVN
jgi:ferric-dicitrate binding protein FerR (iron transport regulator)